MDQEIRRLALAVIALAVQDARTRRRSVVAVFDSRATFDFWCYAAGMTPAAVLERLPATPVPAEHHDERPAA